MSAQHYIQIPRDPIVLVDPISREPIMVASKADPKVQEPVTRDFASLFMDCMSGARWSKDLLMLEAKLTVAAEYRRAKDGDGVMVLSAGNFNHLSAEASSPVRIAENGQAVPGYNIHPLLADQLVPLIHAITRAPTTPPENSM